MLCGIVCLRSTKGLLTNDSGITESESANNLAQVFCIIKPVSANVYLVEICKKNIHTLGSVLSPVVTFHGGLP